ncbi:hypothetical protein T05_14864 [Trichinella murrelli]|uniref:Uncharacterized protein n=1 Tax=Trichinella murrelli TaxID=144512 RepID=A0A0V0U3G1_9BILA|nr:hypothetical protein T05_14864 [Trichinella murrelli]
MHSILERKFRKLLLYAWHLTLAFGGSVVIEYKRLSCGRMEHVRVDLVIADRSHTGTVPKIPRVLGVTTLPSGP